MFAEWIAVTRRTFSEFLADDCMGLAKEVAYSALLAFFPATAFVLGLLGVLHLYDEMESLLATVAPHGVITFVEGLRHDQSGSGKVFALVVGGAGAIWAASGAMGSVIKAVNRAYDEDETRPFWQLRIIAVVLVLLTGVTLLLAGVLIVFGGPLGQAIADKAQFGGAFTVLWSLLRWPVAFGVVIVVFGFLYSLAPDRTKRRLALGHARLGARRAAVGDPLGAVHALRDLRRHLFEDVRHARGGRDPDALAELHCVGDSLRRRAERRARAPQLGAQLGAELLRHGPDDRVAQPRTVLVRERSLRRLECEGERNRLLPGRDLVTAVVA